MNGDIGIGKLIEQERHRDAIHIAVAPVEAGEKLRPGERVGIKDGKAWGTDPAVGIVDPFLLKDVRAGQRFYVFLFPGTITSLRHEWVHPAFDKEAPPAQASPDKAASEKWLREYAAIKSHYDTPEKAYQDLLDGLRTQHLHFHGSDLYSVDSLDDASELARHAEIVIGQRPDWEQFSFSCSC
jgi:hypothetical protein